MRLCALCPYKSISHWVLVVLLLLWLSSMVCLCPVFLPSPQAGHGRWPHLHEPGFSGGFFLFKALANRGSYDRWGFLCFLCIIVESLHNISYRCCHFTHFSFAYFCLFSTRTHSTLFCLFVAFNYNWTPPWVVMARQTIFFIARFKSGRFDSCDGGTLMTHSVTSLLGTW